jgi:hypothetical protein
MYDCSCVMSQQAVDRRKVLVAIVLALATTTIVSALPLKVASDVHSDRGA